MHHRLAALSGLVIATAAHAQTYRYIEIPLLPGTVRSAALGVNNHGDTVGWCRAADNVYYGFLFRYESGELVNLGALGITGSGQEVGAHDINDSGVIVGAMGVSAPGGLRSFYIEDGDFYNISYAPTPNAVIYSGAFGVNAQGMVAGINTSLCANGFNTVTAAVVWTDPTDPQTPPSPTMSTQYVCGIGGFAYGLTDSGTVFGSVQVTTDGLSWETAVAGTRHLPSFSAPRGHASVRDMAAGFACGAAENRDASGPPTGPCYWDPAGTIHRFPTPGSNIFGTANAMNDSLNAVGWTMFTGSRAAALWTVDSPTVVNLNSALTNPPAGYTLTGAEDISDTGFIVGRMNETVSTARAFLLVPCSVTLSTQPTDVQSCRGGPAQFSASAPGPGHTYQWQVNTGSPQSPVWCDLQGSNPAVCIPGSQASMAGALSPNLALLNVTPADARQFRCIVTNACGSVASEPATLSLCLADANCDGFLDFFDYDDFVSAFESGDPSSDFNGDGFLDFFDYDEFVVAYETGC